MYAGHYAVATVLRAREPRAPFWSILIGVGLLDILFAPFVLTGMDRVTLAPETPVGLIFDSIDWSHSLLTTLVWSVLYGALFLGSGKRVAVVAGIAVFSHYPLDLIMHPADLALWPGSETRLGLGLWQTAPPLWWFFELMLIFAGCAYYVRECRRAEALKGGRPVAVALVILGLHVFNSPWVTALTRPTP
jgi:membrane-bound metal-dependent hydrolase YbcI (DUF457 family)